MHTVTRTLEFDAAHRLLKHGGKCRHLHGHRYRVEVECVGPTDSVGVVVDFSVIKAKVGGWIDKQLDHGFIYQFGDMLAARAAEVDADAKLYGMEDPPTAEHLSKLIYLMAVELLRNEPIVMRAVRVWETPNCMAEYRP